MKDGLFLLHGKLNLFILLGFLLIICGFLAGINAPVVEP